MGWRIVCIEEALKLNYKLNSIGVLNNDEIVWINLDEIDLIIIESITCNISSRLLMEICKKGITLIMCSDNHLPIGIFNSIQNNNRAAKLNRLQVFWDNDIKRKVWKEIIKQKILLQNIVLIKFDKNDKVNNFIDYYNSVEDGDVTNREGHAAKIYFHELFGLSFTRERSAEDIINSSLNYMYQVVRAKIAQQIVAHGYNPSIGIFHCNEYNYFGLADDLIEVYRPIIDYFIVKLIKIEEPLFLTPTFKEKMLNVLYYDINFDNSKQKIIESIKLYVVSILDCLTNKKINELKFPIFYE